MNRREALSGLLALGCALSPISAAAQARRRIGVLQITAECPPPAELVDALDKLGWGAGRVEFDCVSAVTRLHEVQALAAALVARKPDVIVTGLLPGVRALKEATRTIPIVALGVADPVGQGLVESLSRPGGNVTGLVSVLLEVEEKRFELLKQLLPGVSRLAAVYREGGEAGYYAAIDRIVTRAGARHSFKHQRFYYRTSADIPRIFDAIAAGRFDAVYLAPGPAFSAAPRLVGQEALKRRLLAFGQGSQLAESGALMSYAPDVAHVAERAAAYVDKILRGAKPADLPIEQPAKFELIVNTRVAKALELAIPWSILLRADRLIE